MFGWISFIQSLIMTLVVIVLLQIKIGEFTLEQRAVDWYRTSNVAAPIQEVAEGGARIVRDAVNKVADSLNFKLFEQVKDRPGQRDMKFRLERSKQFLEEKTRQAAQKIKAELQEESKRAAKEQLDSTDVYGDISEDIDTN